MNILAVIPAKEESNRLFSKNLKKIGNKTLIQLAVEYAKSSKRVKEVVVSTDSEEVKQLVDLNRSEMIILSILAFVSILFGFYPDPLLSTTSASVEGLIDLFNTNIKIYTASN